MKPTSNIKRKADMGTEKNGWLRNMALFAASVAKPATLLKLQGITPLATRTSMNIKNCCVDLATPKRTISDSTKSKSWTKSLSKRLLLIARALMRLPQNSALVVHFSGNNGFTMGFMTNRAKNAAGFIRNLKSAGNTALNARLA
jgi:hypothetical protein